MRILVWLFRAAIFFSLFAFALNNRRTETINWFFGYKWEAPMVLIVLAAFVLGCVFGVLAMVPSWWRHRRVARRRRPEPALPHTGIPAASGTPEPLPSAPPRDGP